MAIGSSRCKSLQIAAAGIFVVVLAGCSSDSGSVQVDPARHQGEGRVRMQKYHVSLVVPEHWLLSDSSDKFAFNGPMENRTGTRCEIYVNPSLDGLSVEEYAKKMHDGLTAMKEQKIVEERFVTIDGKKAWMFLYTPNEKVVMSLNYGVPSNGKIYSIRISSSAPSFDTNRIKFERFIDSLRID